MESKAKVFIFLTIVLAIAVLALSVEVIYLLKNPTNAQTTTEIVPQYNYNLSKRKEHQAVRNEYIEVFVDTEGNAYIYTIDDIDNIDDANIKNNLKKVEKQFSKYSPKDYKNFDETTLSAYKLNLSNVLTVYNVGMGNGGFRYFVFVKENGEISYLNYDRIIDNAEISVKDVKNLKNVVSVIDNEYTQTPYAITLDGEEVSLYEYIK